MRKIVLSSGAEYEVTRCGAADGFLWIEFPHGTIEEAVRVFTDSDNTRTIRSTNDFGSTFDTEFQGFTDLVYISKSVDGAITIALEGEGTK